MASFRGLVAVAGASSTTAGLFAEGCLHRSPVVRRGGGGGGGYESKDGVCLSSASSFRGERIGVSSLAFEVSKPVDAFMSSSKVRVYVSAAGATTTKEQQQYGKSSREMRNSVCVSGGVRTLYDVLGVSQASSAKEIKTAYRQTARKLHPDVVPAEHREDSTKKFLQVQNAYNVLSDDQSRALYDLQLSVQTRVPISIASNWGFTTSSGPSSYYPAADFSSAFKGRSWETDQCW